jgi:hypothetical protein
MAGHPSLPPSLPPRLHLPPLSLLASVRTGQNCILPHTAPPVAVNNLKMSENSIFTGKLSPLPPFTVQCPNMQPLPWAACNRHFIDQICLIYTQAQAQAQAHRHRHRHTGTQAQAHRHRHRHRHRHKHRHRHRHRHTAQAHRTGTPHRHTAQAHRTGTGTGTATGTERRKHQTH